MKRQCKSFL